MKKSDPKLFGVGLDGTDGQTRLTRGHNFSLIGGSEETHAIMRETVIKVNEKLDQRGKMLADLEPREMEDLLGESIDAVGRRRLERN
ncbi:MAG TPA: hypothetical protein DEB39_02845 [Planctomycetaceae bacterium]|nr:hypothetical protein [Planctomycetaceae bacterium]